MFLIPEVRQIRLLSLWAIESGNKTRKQCVEHLHTVFDGSIHVFQPTCQVTQVSHVSHTWPLTTEELHIKGHAMSSEKRQFFCKYWNLHPVVMSDCSLIATRNAHAKHNQLVGRIPRIAEVRQMRLLSLWAIESGNKTRKECAEHLHTIFDESIHEFRPTCQVTQVSHVSHTWALTKKSCTSKGMQWEVKGGKTIANIGTYTL